MSMKPCALICGVSGQDGTLLARLLLENGYHVVGTSRDAEMARFVNLTSSQKLGAVKVVSMSLNDFRSVYQVISEVLPDEIYNLSGQTSVGLSFEQPAETMESIAFGTLNLLEAIRVAARPVKLYNASSSECFGIGFPDKPSDEQSPFRPRSPYGVAKAAAFWEVANYREAYGLFAASGILFNHESPLRPQRFVTQKVVRAACRISRGSQERLMLGRLDVIRDWGWAADYVDAMWRILQHDRPDDFVIATGSSYSLQDFVDRCFRALGLNWEEFVATDPMLIRSTDIDASYANPRKAEKELGWRATVHFEELTERLIRAEIDRLEREA